MTPGESHNEWYQYYCSNICPFKRSPVRNPIITRPECLTFFPQYIIMDVETAVLLETRYAQPGLIFFDFSLTIKAVPHECVIRTGQP